MSFLVGLLAGDSRIADGLVVSLYQPLVFLCAVTQAIGAVTALAIPQDDVTTRDLSKIQKSQLTCRKRERPSRDILWAILTAFACVQNR